LDDSIDNTFVSSVRDEASLAVIDFQDQLGPNAKIMDIKKIDLVPWQIRPTDPLRLLFIACQTNCGR
jgi:hypothetical protein